MSAGDEYLARLRRQLKGFSTEEQADLVAEIQSHLESGQADPGLGDAPERRENRLMAEMGSPSELGKGFQAVHRPRRWLDFLLIAVPIYVVIPLLLPLSFVLLKTSPPDLSAPVLALDIRLSVILGLAFCLVGLWRRSALLLAFWIPDVATRLVSQLVRENFVIRMTGYHPAFPFETWAWVALLFVLLICLARFLWKNRQDSLILIFATLPLWESIINMSAYASMRANAIDWNPVFWNLLGVWKIGNFVSIASLAGFCLLDRRGLRWLSLLAGVSFFNLINAYTFWPDPMLAVWTSLLPLVLLIAWLYDRHRRMEQIR